MKKLIVLNFLLTAVICDKLDVSQSIIENVVHHSNNVDLAYELATTGFDINIVFNSLFEED